MNGNYNIRETRFGFVVMSPDKELLGRNLDEHEAKMIADVLNRVADKTQLQNWLASERGKLCGRGIKLHLDGLLAA